MARKKKKTEISCNELIMLAIAVFVVSIFCTAGVLGSYGGITGFLAAENTTGYLNITIPSNADISLVVDNISFSNAVGTVNYTNSSGSSPRPIQIQNDGTVTVDINFTFNKNATQFFSGTSHQASLQWNCSVASTVYGDCNSTNYTDDAVSAGWSNVNDTFTTAEKILIRELNFSNANDNLSFHIRIRVPADELEGTKNATVLFTAVQAV